MHYTLCVMGNPIDHSKSPWIHDQFAKQLGLSVKYIKIKPDIDGFFLAVDKFRKEGGYGFNVTLPFKQVAYNIADEKSERASIAKAVNTMLFKSDGSLFGDNTDGAGLLNDIVINHGYSLKEKIILILGAGGAARGILQPLLSQFPAEIIVANRTIANALQLAAEFSCHGKMKGCGFDDLTHLKVDVIIDATGFSAHLSFPETLSLSTHSLCYDLKYSHFPTDFMVWAKEKGSHKIVDGLGMLVEQAAEAFFIWTGKKPETPSVISLAKKLFNANSE